MITRILFHLGGYYTSFDLQRFCTINADRLLEKGIIYPTTLLSRDRGFGAEHMGAQVLLCDFASSRWIEKYYNELRLLHQTYSGYDSPLTLIFSIPQALEQLHKAPLAANDLQIFRKAFPQAEIDALLVLSRQDLEYEAMLSRQALCKYYWSPPPYGYIKSLSSYYFNYSVLYHSIENAFGSGHCKVFIDNGGDRGSAVARVMKQNYGITDLSTFDVPAPSPYALLPQDVLWFVHLHTAAVRQAGTKDYLDWSQEKALLEGGELPPRVLNPGHREWLLNRVAPWNAAFAQEHGQGVFSSEEGESHDEGWKPFSGFAPDHAFRLASLLSTGAAEEYLRVIDEIPSVERSPLLREVEQGLRAALALGPPAYLRERQPKVTVLTMCYNHEKYIETTIKGVLAQETNFPVEHVIADDGSSDGSREIILDYAARHSSITPLFRSERLAFWEGHTVSRLFAMAKSPYVSLCDGDDYFCDPQKLQRQVDFLDANPRYSICFHPVHMVWENKAQEDRPFPRGREIPPHGLPYTLTDLVRWNFMSTSSVMYRWRFADGLPNWFFADALPGDWYWHMLHAESGRIGMLPEIMSVYRRHNDGVWCYAETDRGRHKELYGTKELRTYEIMNAHFKGRFGDLFFNRMVAEFSMLYELAVDGVPGPFERAIQEFPDWAGKIVGYAKGGGGG